MKPQMMLLFAAILYLLIQDFFRGGKAAYNNGVLILESGETLEINTTAPSVEKIGCPSCSLTASLENRSSAHGEHQVAIITFSGDIMFKNGSTVKVSGKNALSLTSQDGDILIETDINMTCDEKVFNTTCLGGFTQSSPPIKLLSAQGKPVLYRGSGPGGLNVSKPVDVRDQCIPGSSHGGKALSNRPNILDSGPEYDQQSNTSLLGGSAGSCLESPGSVAGGGAIELVAENGWITINASINASAQKDPENSKECSGGSGGLIRLKAARVDVLENGKLSAEGGNSQRPPQNSHQYLSGGAGGIIQIISPKGSLIAGSLLLGQGSSVGQYCEILMKNYNADGYFHLLGPPSESGHHGTFPNATLRWGESSSSTIPPSLTATTVQQSSATTIVKLSTTPTASGATNIVEPSSSISQVQSSVHYKGRFVYIVNIKRSMMAGVLPIKMT